MALRIGIVGAGSIGCYIGAALQMGGAEVCFLGRPRMAKELAECGLHISDLRGLKHSIDAQHVRFYTEFSALPEQDIVIITVKSGDTASVAEQLAPLISTNTTVISLQNGVANATILRQALPSSKVLAGMIAFNVLQMGEGRFHAGTDGAVMVEAVAEVTELGAALAVSGTPFEAQADMRSVLWSKLLLNLNNPINALSGLPLKAELSQRAYRRCLGLLQREALAAITAAEIPLQRLTAVPASMLPFILALPDFLFTRLAQPMLAIDPMARSSMWEDLERGRKTEVEWLNGEVLSLAFDHGLTAPANARLKALVHSAEEGGRRDYSGAELWTLISKA
ncbi:2-dehydropantoate 2-reductase [Zhongshania antarctica]|uniref:2-dehydropantoate 2-reductase n=1 Tax=Zhongshania antarctica TaxID=641702 RepID=A0A840R759_9GAMM|nr:2-dehydropantoate 2-reductase [Zhongshania antarctica]MBB5188707.1 2-dehydropantoate 2-reductase [Zhongshania antarctica]